MVGKVGGVEAAAVGISQEADRPGREGFSADELADAAYHLLAVFVDGCYIQAQAAGLAAAYPDGQLGWPRTKQPKMSVPPEIDCSG